MLCPSCGRENPEGAKFCGECGTPFRQDVVVRTAEEA